MSSVARQQLSPPLESFHLHFEVLPRLPLFLGGNGSTFLDLVPICCSGSWIQQLVVRSTKAVSASVISDWNQGGGDKIQPASRKDLGVSRIVVEEKGLGGEVPKPLPSPDDQGPPRLTSTPMLSKNEPVSQ